MNNQEIFDKVAVHLLTQAQPSLYGADGGQCMYRGEGGMMCAVGCLITDEYYDPALEHSEVRSAVVRRVLVQAGVLPEVETEHGSEGLALLTDLQHIHDTQQPSDWRHALLCLAGDYELDMTVLRSHYTL